MAWPSFIGRDDPGRRSWWIPCAFVAFFGVVLVANVTMIAIAFWSWTGLETDRAWRSGLAYNRALEAERAQMALGWDAALDFEQGDERRATVALTLEDRHGNLIKNAHVEAWFVRPTHDGYDFRAVVPNYHAGTYRAEVTLPLAGQWDVRVVATSGGDTYRLRKRVHLRP